MNGLGDRREGVFGLLVIVGGDSYSEVWVGISTYY